MVSKLTPLDGTPRKLLNKDVTLCRKPKVAGEPTAKGQGLVSRVGGLYQMINCGLPSQCVHNPVRNSINLGTFRLSYQLSRDSREGRKESSHA